MNLSALNQTTGNEQQLQLVSSIANSIKETHVAGNFITNVFSEENINAVLDYFKNIKSNIINPNAVAAVQPQTHGAMGIGTIENIFDPKETVVKDQTTTAVSDQYNNILNGFGIKPIDTVGQTTHGTMGIGTIENIFDPKEIKNDGILVGNIKSPSIEIQKSSIIPNDTIQTNLSKIETDGINVLNQPELNKQFNEEALNFNDPNMEQKLKDYIDYVTSGIKDNSVQDISIAATSITPELATNKEIQAETDINNLFKQASENKTKDTIDPMAVGSTALATDKIPAVALDQVDVNKLFEQASIAKIAEEEIKKEPIKIFAPAIPKNDLLAFKNKTEEEVLKSRLKKEIKGNEGFKPKPYLDGKEGQEKPRNWTVGYGHFLGQEKKGEAGDGLPKEWRGKTITKDDAEKIFNKDFDRHFEIAKNDKVWPNLNYSGKEAFMDMTYNMGSVPAKLPKAAYYLGEGNITKAIKEIEHSDYPNQVGKRADKNIAKLKDSYVGHKNNAMPVMLSEDEAKKELSKMINTFKDEKEILGSITSNLKNDSLKEYAICEIDRICGTKPKEKTKEKSHNISLDM